MIDLEKSKIEAEALAKLRKEQYFREVLAGELGVMIDQHFASREPLREIIPVFCTALKDLAICAREIFDYLEGLQEVAPKEPEQAAEEAAKYVQASQRITAELNKNNTKTLQEMVDEQAEKAPSTAAVKVSNERIEQLQAEGLSPTQIAKVTGMKPDTVTHRIRYNKDKIDRKKGIIKPEATPRILSKDIISDTELEEQYFKFGKTVKEIAQKYGIKPDGLYKRVEAMKAERQNIAKECVSSQQ